MAWAPLWPPTPSEAFTFAERSLVKNSAAIKRNGCDGPKGRSSLCSVCRLLGFTLPPAPCPHPTAPCRQPPRLHSEMQRVCAAALVCVSALITHTGSATPPWPESLSSTSLCNPFIRRRDRDCVSVRACYAPLCCRSKSPLPCFCCVYYAMYFRSLIRSASV